MNIAPYRHIGFGVQTRNFGTPGSMLLERWAARRRARRRRRENLARGALARADGAVDRAVRNGRGFRHTNLADVRIRSAGERAISQQQHHFLFRLFEEQLIARDDVDATETVGQKRAQL